MARNYVFLPLLFQGNLFCFSNASLKKYLMNYWEYKCVLSPPAGPVQYYENLYKPRGHGLPVCSTKGRQEAHISEMSLTKHYLRF